MYGKVSGRWRRTLTEQGEVRGAAKVQCGSWRRVSTASAATEANNSAAPSRVLRMRQSPTCGGALQHLSSVTRLFEDGPVVILVDDSDHQYGRPLHQVPREVGG